ncbi:hypothetical protein EON67_05465 [archaeon]|nr:MAG: hypothetical protein EON67_05465 [archaeon]
MTPTGSSELLCTCRPGWTGDGTHCEPYVPRLTRAPRTSAHAHLHTCTPAHRFATRALRGCRQPNASWTETVAGNPNVAKNVVIGTVVLGVLRTCHRATACAPTFTPAPSRAPRKTFAHMWVPGMRVRVSGGAVGVGFLFFIIASALQKRRYAFSNGMLTPLDNRDVHAEELSSAKAPQQSV